MKKRKIQVKSILRLGLLILCAVMLGVNVYLVNAGRLMGNPLPMPFGYGAAVVLSGSMEPELSKGDLIVVGLAEEVRLRDIVVYRDKSSLVVHRVIAVEGDTLITQGDANRVADEPISLAAVKGKVLFKIPYAGTLVEWIKSPVGTLFLLIAAVLLVEIPRRMEKKKDDLERERILEEIRRLKDEL